MRREAAILAGAVLLAAVSGVIALRETLFAQTFCQLETHGVPVEIDLYDHCDHSWMIGAPWYSLFALQKGKRTYIGDLDLNDSRADLCQSKDGKLVIIVSDAGTTAYEISTQTCIFSEKTHPTPEEIIAAHGGSGISLLESAAIMYRYSILRDLVPREAF